MKEFKGTPGPWFVEHGTRVENESFHLLCEVFGDVTSLEEDETNAMLIAAAPELLSALQGVIRVADRDTDEFIAARAAVAKALGESQ